MASINEDMVDAFHFYDSKGDKKIAANQIGNCLRSLNLQPTEALIQKMTGQWKDKPETRISLEEFAPIYHNIKKESSTDPSFQQFLTLAQYFDRDGSGSIMLADLRLMLQNAGEKLSSEEVDTLLMGMDLTEGKVNANDFIKQVMSL